MGENKAGDMLSHLYGLAGLVPGLIGLFISFKVDSPWSEYLLCASGWLAAMLYVPLFMRSIKLSREDAKILGYQKRNIEDLQKELANRNATLDYVAGLKVGISAVPRVIAKTGEGETSQRED